NIFRYLLLDIHAEPELSRSGAMHQVDVGHAARLIHKPDRIGIRTRIGVIHIAQQTDGAGMVSGLVADLAFYHVAAIAKQPAVEAKSVRNLGLGGAAIAKRPPASVKFVDPSPRVPARVGRIVPGAVVHDGPAHELRPWIVRVAVVVEEVCKREPTGIDRVPRLGP